MSTVNFRDYAVRENGVLNETATMDKFRMELRNYVENLEPSHEKIQALVDQCLFDHRGEVVNTDFVSGQVATKLSAGRAANFSPIKRLVGAFISAQTKGENPRYRSARGRGTGGLRLLDEVSQQMELNAALNTQQAAELSFFHKLYRA